MNVQRCPTGRVILEYDDHVELRWDKHLERQAESHDQGSTCGTWTAHNGPEVVPSVIPINNRVGEYTRRLCGGCDFGNTSVEESPLAGSALNGKVQLPIHHGRFKAVYTKQSGQGNQPLSPYCEGADDGTTGGSALICPPLAAVPPRHALTPGKSPLEVL